MELLKVPPQRTGESRGSSLKRKFAQIDYPPDSASRIGNVPAENCHDAYGHQESTTRKQPAALNLRSHSLDKLRQIVTTGAFLCQHSVWVVTPEIDYHSQF
eukprot:COSAG01_NODE_29916_length_627_cov_0.740530_1_plen_101_part_00